MKLINSLKKCTKKTQRKKENMNVPVSIKEMKFQDKIISTKISPHSDDFICELYQTIVIFHKIAKKSKRGRQPW